MNGSFDAGPLARLLSNGINPLLFLLLVAAPLLDRRRRNQPAQELRTRRWIAASVVGIAMTVVLAELGKHFQVWTGHPEFPSGHGSFAAAATAALIARDWRWALVAVPLALTIGWALVGAGYHEPIEVIGGMALGSVVTGGIVGVSERAVSASTA